MGKEKGCPDPRGGRYLPQEEGKPSGSVRKKRRGRYLTVAVLLLWDGLLLYMIVRCLIVPVYGAVFIGTVSVCLGYQINQEV